MTEFRRQRGVTLLELMVAMVLSATALGLAIGIYLRSTGQFNMRTGESDAFQETVLIDREIENRIKKRKIESCGGGEIRLTGTGSLFEFIKSSHPGISKLKVFCYEAVVTDGRLVSWETMPFPLLVEYDGVLRAGGREWVLTGSVLK